MPRSRSPVGRTLAVIRRVLLPTLLLATAGFVTGGPASPAPRATPPRACAADLMHPLMVRVIPEGPVRPGAAVSATVEVTARRPLDGVVIRMSAPSDVALLSAPSRGLGAMRAGEVRREILTVVAPRGGPRRMVEVRVQGTVDGVSVSRGAALNLALDKEPAREVPAPGGRTVREVTARRIG